MHIDALPLHRKYSDVFLMDDVPEAERKDVARQVADKIIGMLRRQEQLERHIPNGFSGDLPEIAQSRLGIPGRLDGSTTYKTAQERGTGGAAST